MAKPRLTRIGLLDLLLRHPSPNVLVSGMMTKPVMMNQRGRRHPNDLASPNIQPCLMNRVLLQITTAGQSSFAACPRKHFLWCY